jgi:hypothetical protein
MRSIIYHHVAERCTLTRDEIQGRLAALDDILAFGEMIYQACGLDKKITARKPLFFGGEGEI